MNTENAESDSPPRARRWFRHVVWTLMLATILASISTSWFAVEMHRAKKQKEAVAQLGGNVTYDYMVDHDYNPVPDAKPFGPTWFRDLLGYDLFTSVVGLDLGHTKTTAAAMERVKELPQLRHLSLEFTDFTDAGLKHLEALNQLEVI